MAIYSNLTDTFKVLDYLLTHKQLLIRSLKTGQRDYNIDIVFKPVDGMLMKTTIEGIEIDHVDAAIEEPAVKAIGFSLKQQQKVFVITDKMGNKQYINAMAVGVYHNKLDTLESSLGRYDYGELGENILWYNI
jgi:hypothetical protein